jgi:uncharacterized protein (DUF2236 family)
MQQTDNGLFPSDAEIDSLVVGPESVTWQFTSDVRLFLAPLYALLLQVAHPTVGAGVRDFSDFDHRPWERLLRTIDYLVLMQYGGRDAAAVGRRLRELHKAFTGTGFDGRPYYALERSAYAWVHATLLDTYVRAHQHFGRPMSGVQIERFYREYLGLGRLVGMRSDDLPQDWKGFRAYFDHMVDHELGHNETVDRVLAAARQPAMPEVAAALVFKTLLVAPTRAAHLGGVGLLPASLRERLGVAWTSRDERAFRALGAASRAITPVLPAKLKIFGPTHLRWRRRAIARGPLGPGRGHLEWPAPPSG